MATRSISGSRARLYANGIEIGFAVSVSGTETNTLSRVDTLGSAYTKEIVTNRRVIQVSAQLVRIYEGSAKALGLMARGSTTAILNFPPISMVLYDSIEDSPLETIEGAVIEQRTWNVDAAGLLNEGVSFQATKMLDEGEE